MDSEATKPLSITDRYKAMNVSQKYWWKVVALCFFGWILMYADRTILNPVQTQLASQFNISNT